MLYTFDATRLDGTNCRLTVEQTNLDGSLLDELSEGKSVTVLYWKQEPWECELEACVEGSGPVEWSGVDRCVIFIAAI